MDHPSRDISNNPLISGLNAALPPYGRIAPRHITPALDWTLEENRQRLAALVELTTPSWENLMQPLETMEERLQRVWGPATHLNAVCDSDELRQIYQQGQQKVSAYQTELAQNEVVFAALKCLRQDKSFAALSTEQRQVVGHALRDFRLSGAELSTKDKSRFKQIQLRLAELAATFEQNVMDATRSFELHLLDEGDAAGLPASIMAAARQRAGDAGKKGWLFTLDAPSYVPFMQYAESRDLRREMYAAYVTRASEGDLDNSPLVDEILCLRQQAAGLLGFANYAALSLAPKMAESVEQVCGFLRGLAEKSRATAETELAELRQFAAADTGMEKLEAWDMAFVSERLRQKRFDFSQEELKPYFPESQALAGLFSVVERLYGVTARERRDAPKWHDAVRYFDLMGADDNLIAGFYLDPYARAHKRGGAWMDECTIRWKKPDGALQLPVAYLVCNFDAPVGDRPALWTHDEVITLFHEFGHGLHHMLTRIETLGVSGIRGVPWDAVELPSQFMENYCWEREALNLFARHYQTDERLPDALFEKMRKAKTFQAGMHMLRQIELALFDILLHTQYDPASEATVQDMLDAVRKEVAVIIPPAFNKFQNSFSHIFAGGYAAGYYSYKWAEVLSADAFAAFEESAIFDPETASALREHVLSRGGSIEIMDGFVAFRGRKPELGALLRHSGIAAQASS
ncbi:MAG: M3 family metallopeptidase [Mariprofundaceae bacterium]